MANPLIIVESPAKAKTLSRFLGGKYDIRASMGHVRDLPKSTLGIDIEHSFAPEYVTIPGKESTIKDLKAAAKGASDILLASDPDREGEAIAWHLAHVLNLKDPRRIELHEITPTAVEKALNALRPMNQDLVDAQQARRVIDRLVGYKLSPLLWKKIRKGLSAGRVQSVAVRLVCEREEEIEKFVPVESWTLDAMLSKLDLPQRVFAARLLSNQGSEEKLDLTQESQVREIIGQLEGASYKVLSIETKDSTRNAPPPYKTSTLQQDASNRLRLKPNRTMSLAQQLYEGVELGTQGPVGLITYMRTDSFRISDEAATATRHFITEQFGPTYARRDKVEFKAKGPVQDAHEAIRPTDVERTPDSMRPFLTPDLFKLYRLIWQRFTASQMSAARFAQTRVDIGAADYVFRANGSVLVFDGFYRVWERDSDNDEEKELPALAVDEGLNLRELKPEQHFTQPPPRYTEASLIKALEELGVGRPSTFAPTVEVIQTRHYVKQEERRLSPTDLGKTVNAWLVEHFPDIVDVTFTAGMEEELDDVEEGRRKWVPIVREFYAPFSKTLSKAEATARVKVPMRETGEDCPKCKQEGRTGRLVYRMSKLGEFVGCSLYPSARHQRLAAFRAHLAGGLRWRRLLLALATLDVIALGIQRAADELAELAHAVDETASASLLLALGTVLAGFPHGDLDTRRGLGFGQCLGERRVELADDGHPLAPPFLDVIELLLHAGGGGDVDDVREMLHEPRIDGLAKLGWGQPALLLLDVMARLDDLDGRGKGA